MLRLQTKLWFLKLITCLRQEAGRATVGEGARKSEEGRKREGGSDLSSLEPNNESVNKTPTHRQRHRAPATSLSFVGGELVGWGKGFIGGFDVIRLLFSLLQMTDPQGIHEIHSRLPSISHNHWGVFFFLDSPNNDDPVQAFSCTAEKGSKERGRGEWGRGKGNIKCARHAISLTLIKIIGAFHSNFAQQTHSHILSSEEKAKINWGATTTQQFHINLSYLR